MLRQDHVAQFGLTLSEDCIRAAEVGFGPIEPWHWLDIDKCKSRREGLKKRYPTRDLIPFAERQDCDDVACWDMISPDAVSVIHDYADSGWETKATYVGFREWLHQALDDCLDFV